MALTDTFKLAPVSIDRADGVRSPYRLTMDPDDREGRGIEARFQDGGRAADLSGATAMLWWRHDQAPALRGLEPFDMADAKRGVVRVHFPSDMGASKGTVTAKVVVRQGGSEVAVRLPKIWVAGGRADPNASPSEDNFSVLGELMVQYEEGLSDLSGATSAASAAAKRADDAAGEALSAAGAVSAAASAAEGAAARANDAATAAETNAASAGAAAARADASATAADAAAGEASAAAEAASAAAGEATAQGDYAKERGDEARSQAAHAKEQGDYAKAQGDEAGERASAAESAAESAEGAATDARAAAGAASASATSASEAAASANGAASAASEAAEAANGAAGAASESARAADSATDRAEAAAKAAEDGESKRAGAEDARAEAERLRAAAELERQDAEDARAEAERLRAAAEILREGADRDRAERQSANDTAQARNDADQRANNKAALGLTVRILRAGEYDPDTRVPTIDGDLANVFCVPTAEAEAAMAEVRAAEAALRLASDAAGESPSFDGGAGPAVESARERLASAYAEQATNHYMEWLWILDDEGDGYWEPFGTSEAILPEGVTTEEIDRMFGGETVSSQHIGDAAGLSYLVARAKGEISAQDAAIAAAQASADAAQRAAEAAAATAASELSSAVGDQTARNAEQDAAIEAAKKAGDDAASALGSYKGEQGKRDEEQDTAIEKAQKRADEAYDHVPDVVTSKAVGILPAFPSDGGPFYPTAEDGALKGWLAIPVFDDTRAGLVPAAPEGEVKVLLSTGWGDYKGGGLPDYRALKAAIAAAEKAKTETKVQGGGDYEFGTPVASQQALSNLEAAIATAQGVLDKFEDPSTTQDTLDAAATAMNGAVETFKASVSPLQPDKAGLTAQETRYTQLKGSVVTSTDGKDVPFGDMWVTSAEQQAADTALQAARTAVEAAKKQSDITSAVNTLDSALDTYESARKTATKDTAALDRAIGAANAAKEGVETSDQEGDDLPAGSRYVTLAQMGAFEAAIKKATTAKTESTTQKQLDEATSTLAAATETFSGQIKQNVSIYGVRFDGFPSTTKGVRTDAAEDFGDVKPAVSNGSGSSPFDEIAPWSEMKAEDRVGGRMVKIPKFYYKLTQNGKGVNVQIATGPMDGFKVSPAHMDRNDGKGEREVVYVGRYHCATSTYKSTTGVNPAASATKANMISSIHSIDSTYHMMDFATRFTIWLLYIVETAEWNSQKLIGGGCSTSGSVMQMGYTDKMKYCTGTSATSIGATVYGGTQYRNIEGLWDNVYDFLSGCYNDSKGLNVITDTSKLGDSSGGKTIGLPVASYPGELKVTETGGFPAFYPSAAGGSDSTGTCDNWNFGSGYPVVYAGGGCNQGSYHGMFCLYCASASYSSADHGCRLLELP